MRAGWVPERQAEKRSRSANENARHKAWRFEIWGGRWESNPRHQEPQSCALPTELRPPYRESCRTFRLQPQRPDKPSLKVVRTERLELSRLAALEPKSSVSTNSTTSAGHCLEMKTPGPGPGASEYGVDDGNRTHDTRSHNPVLYQLSYAHHITTCGKTSPASCRFAEWRTRQDSNLRPSA